MVSATVFEHAAAVGAASDPGRRLTNGERELVEFRGGSLAVVSCNGKAPSGGATALELRVPARLENLALVRALVAAVAAFEELGLDAIADLRLAIDEACTLLIRAAEPDPTSVAHTASPWSLGRSRSRTTTS